MCDFYIGSRVVLDDCRAMHNFVLFFILYYTADRSVQPSHNKAGESQAKRN